MKRTNVTIPDDLYEFYKQNKNRINLSQILARALEEELADEPQFLERQIKIKEKEISANQNDLSHLKDGLRKAKEKSKEVENKLIERRRRL